MRKVRILFVVCVVAVLAFTLAILSGCKTTTTTETTAAAETTAVAAETTTTVSAETTSKPQAKDVNIIVVGVNWQHPYWADVTKGVEYAKKALGINLTIVGPMDVNWQGEADALEQAIGQKPTGIMVAAFDPTIIPSIKKAIEAGIPIVTFESDIKESGRLCFIGVNNYDYGIQLGKNLIEASGEKGTLAISTNAGAANSELRIQGLKDFLKDYPSWEIVGQTEDKADIQTGANAAKALLQTHPDLTAYIGINASSGPAIATAAKEMGVTDKLTILCCDRDNTTLDLIKEGVIKSSVAAKTVSTPYWAAVVLINYVESGRDIPITNDNEKAKVVTMPDNIYTGAVVITKENVDLLYQQ
ncbi:MAG: substrate-binding domain-containing protein [Actinobacteria bacterium]|nr:substrate-binding domain-containing protein [Actinomycetota bacterium]